MMSGWFLYEGIMVREIYILVIEYWEKFEFKWMFSWVVNKLWWMNEGFKYFVIIMCNGKSFKSEYNI